MLICYRLGSAPSFIARIQLLEIAAPPVQAVVLHDDATPLQSTSPQCYTSHVDGKVPSAGAAMTLALDLDFQSTKHRILLGAVGIKVKSIDPAQHACLDTIADLWALAPGAIKCPNVLGYHTPDDGGGGAFYWDAASTEPQNGGTVFKSP